MQAPLRWRSTAPSVAVREPEETCGDWENARSFNEIPSPQPAPVIGNIWRFLPGTGRRPEHCSALTRASELNSFSNLLGDLAGLKQKQLMKHLHDQYGPIVILTVPTKEPFILLQNPTDFEKVLQVFCLAFSDFDSFRDQFSDALLCSSRF